ncbi:MAG: outer-membrane lipoprotein carrier protein LolA [Candidatus Edwardsbacteria bacterium]
MSSLVLLISLSQLLSPISGNFIKETKQGKKISEIVSGKFYYAPPSQLLFHVYNPLEQIFTFNGDTLILFYPKEKKAFKIKSLNPMVSSSVSSTWTFNDKIDFSKLGYLFVKKQKMADTLYSYWVPKGKSVIKAIIIGRLKNRMVSIEIDGVQQNQFSKILYTKHLQHNSFCIPTETYSIQCPPADTLIEHFTYQDIRFDIEIPDSISHFSIPNGIPVKEVVW